MHGPSDRENEPSYIEESLAAGYDVEVDVWFYEGGIWLGHDKPTYHVNPSFLKMEGLWCHAKNFAALNALRIVGAEYFWHQEDDYTLTSSGYIWTYPGKKLGHCSIMVMPESCFDGLNSIDKSVYGICSDYVAKINENAQHRHEVSNF